MFIPRKPLHNTDDSTAGGGIAEPPAPPSPPPSDGFDMDGAVEQLAAGLGLEVEEPPPEKDAAEPPAPSPSPAPVPSPAPSPAPVASTPGQAPPIDLTSPPKTWRPEAQALWATLPEAARAEIHKREQDIWKGLEGYKQEVGFSRQIQQTLRPVSEQLQQLGLTPMDFVGRMTNMHLNFSNPQVPVQQKLAWAKEMLGSYGLDFDQLLSGAGPDDGAPPPDPAVKALQEKIDRLESQLTARANTEATQIRETLKSEVDKFAADPANKYFEEVADDIVLLLRGSEGKMTLKEAYDRAVYANPVTRAKEQERLTAEALAREREEAKKRTQNARRATGANVNGRRHPASETTAEGSMDDTLAKTLESIKSRAH